MFLHMYVTTSAGHPVPWSGPMNTEIKVHCWVQFYQGNPLLNIHRTNRSLSCFASSPKNSAILIKLFSTETDTSHAQQVSETFTTNMTASLQHRDKFQTHKSSKIILGVIPFIKLQTETTIKQWKTMKNETES